MIAEMLLTAALATAFTSAPMATSPGGALDAPAPIFMTDCTAQLDCPAPFSGSVSCQGVSSCQIYNNGLYGVYCDGNFVGCRCTGLPTGYCNSAIDYCQCRSEGGSHHFCMTWCAE